MCLYTRERCPSTATEDIPIFKMLCKTRKGYLSPYYPMVYVLGKEARGSYPDQFSHIYISGSYEIGKGVLHSFTDMCEAEWHLKELLISDASMVIVEGYIPKGARYWTNYRGAAASDRLVLTKEINNHVSNYTPNRPPNSY